MSFDVNVDLVSSNSNCILFLFSNCDDGFIVGWGASSAVQNFGEPTTKAQLLNLIRSIRTVAKSK